MYETTNATDAINVCIINVGTHISSKVFSMYLYIYIFIYILYLYIYVYVVIFFFFYVNLMFSIKFVYLNILKMYSYLFS